MRHGWRVARRQVTDAVQRLALTLQPRGLILVYHRVAAVQCDPLLLCVRPENFLAHMEIIRRKFHPLSLHALRGSMDTGIPERAVAVTFDDGYADNLFHAAPGLRSAGVPATVFFSPGLARVGSYGDRLKTILLETRSLPERMEIQIMGNRHAWDFGRWKDLPDEPGETYWAWNMEMEGCPSPRHRAFRDLHRMMRSMTGEERTRLLAQIESQAGGPFPGREEDRFLTMEELQEISRDGIIRLGAHTMSHPVLCRRSLAEQRAEMQESKRILEQQTGAAVDSFAYPYGSPWDVSAQTVDLVRQTGFFLACANTPGQVTRFSDPYWLPRWLVRDWSGEEFEKKIESFLFPVVVRAPVGCLSGVTAQPLLPD